VYRYFEGILKYVVNYIELQGKLAFTFFLQSFAKKTLGKSSYLEEENSLQRNQFLK